MVGLVDTPADIPELLKKCPKSWSEEYVDNVIRSDVQTGRQKRRRKSTLRRRNVSFNWRFNYAEYDAFWQWFNITLMDGLRPIKMINPMNDKEEVYYFTETPNLQASDKIVFDVSVRLVSDYD